MSRRLAELNFPSPVKFIHLLLFMVHLATILFAVYSRIDFSDEGYYVTIAAHALESRGNLAGIPTSLLFLISFGDLRVFRFFGIVLLYVSSFFFCSKVLLYLGAGSAYVRGIGKNYNLAINTTPALLYILQAQIVTPNYNIVLYASLLFLGGILISVISNSRKNLMREEIMLGVLVGILLTALLLSKPFSLLFGLFVLIIALARKRPCFVSTSALTHLALLILCNYVVRGEKLIYDFRILQETKYLEDPKYQFWTLLKEASFGSWFQVAPVTLKVIQTLPILYLLLFIVVGFGEFRGVPTKLSLIRGILLWVPFLAFHLRPAGPTNQFLFTLLTLFFLVLVKDTSTIKVKYRKYLMVTLLSGSIIFLSTFGTSTGFWGRSSWFIGVLIPLMQTTLGFFNVQELKKTIFAVALGICVAFTINPIQDFTSGDNSRMGSIWNLSTSSSLGKFGMLYVNENQKSKLESLQILKNKLEKLYGKKSLETLDLSDFEPLYPVLLDLKPSNTILINNPARYPITSERSLRYINRMLEISQEKSIITEAKPIIILSDRFLICVEKIFCSTRKISPKIAKNISQYLPEFPHDYIEIGRLGTIHIFGPNLIISR